MSEIKRYDEYRHDNGLYVYFCGKWCKYEDVEPIIKRNAELEEKVANYDNWLSGGVYFTTEEYQNEVDTLNSKSSEIIKLEAELARLRVAVQNLNKWLDNTGYDEFHPWRISLRAAEGLGS